MIGRTEIFMKWLLYAAGVFLCCLLHGFVLQYWDIFGVMPFLFPMIPAVIAMYEGPFSGTICGIAVGVLCDLTIAAPIPCFYTLVFPIVSLFAGILAKSWLKAGFPCALTASLLAFLLTDAVHFLLVVFGGGAANAALWLAARETGASIPFLIPVYFIFREIYQICHMYD